MGQTLDALELRGLVARAADPSDRRQVLISLTRSGRKALGRGRGLRQAWFVDAMTTQLTVEERRTLFKAIDLLDQIVRSDAHPKG